MATLSEKPVWQMVPMWYRGDLTTATHKTIHPHLGVPPNAILTEEKTGGIVVFRCPAYPIGPLPTEFKKQLK